MRKALLIITALLTLGSCNSEPTDESNSIREAIETMLALHPSSTLQDIYKSCFQDYYGVSHLLADRASVKQYIEHETATADSLVGSYYEPCGWRAQFIRVNLSAVKDGRITSERLTDAFMASARYSTQNATDEWQELWPKIAKEARAVCPTLKNFSADSAAIAAMLARGRYVMHHSPEYRKAHHPHYRIIHRSIFERDILPLLQ